MSELERYLFLRVVEGPNGCWLWTGRINHYGYGEVVRKGRYVGAAHRVVYEFLVAEIPSGLTLDHLCRVRNCVNPWHVEPVPPGLNTLRGTSFSAINARKTHCPQGHPYSGTDINGYRRCRVCMRAAEKRSRRRAA